MAKDQGAATAVAEPEIRKETLAEIRELEKQISYAEMQHETHKDEAASWKKRFDSLVGQLRDKCRSLSEPLPLFEGNGQAHGDGWRSIPIEEALPGLSAPLVEKLIQAELNTMGQLADYTAADKRLTEIAGIGKAKAEQIEKSLESFWERRNDAGVNGAADHKTEAEDESDGPDAA